MRDWKRERNRERRIKEKKNHKLKIHTFTHVACNVNCVFDAIGWQKGETKKQHGIEKENVIVTLQ